ncbi:MAG: NAD(P)H-binding protein [Alphaproteobacteria bacterium]|nr:NAD(P)H-binding protein [Alphaproteobacteria bacterium]
MHFLVTGATGFIGQSVVEAALKQGHQVTTLVRSPPLIGNSPVGQ